MCWGPFKILHLRLLTSGAHSPPPVLHYQNKPHPLWGSGRPVVRATRGGSQAVRARSLAWSFRRSDRVAWSRMVSEETSIDLKKPWMVETFFWKHRSQKGHGMGLAIWLCMMSPFSLMGESGRREKIGVWLVAAGEKKGRSKPQGLFLFGCGPKTGMIEGLFSQQRTSNQNHLKCMEWMNSPSQVLRLKIC